MRSWCDFDRWLGKKTLLRNDERRSLSSGLEVAVNEGTAPIFNEHRGPGEDLGSSYHVADR